MEDELREKIVKLLDAAEIIIKAPPEFYAMKDKVTLAIDGKAGIADDILSLLAPELDKLKRLQREAHLLAMFILQSPYYKDPDVREAVDNVLGLTMTDIIKGEVKDAG